MKLNFENILAVSMIILGLCGAVEAHSCIVSTQTVVNVMNGGAR